MSTKTVGAYMIENPVTISADLCLSDAGARMQDHGIRHLPVVEGARVVGIVSERDLAMVSALPGVDPGQVRVTEAMHPDPYIAAPDTPLREVLAIMHKHKLGTAVIAEGGELLGIFTVIDALGLLRELV